MSDDEHPEDKSAEEAAAPATEESKPEASTDSSVPSTSGDKSAETDASAKTAEVVKTSDAAAYTPSYVFLIVVTFVNLVADLWSKAWAKNHFESLRPGDPRRVVILEDHMNFIFAKNRGGAWGLLQNETEALRRPFFLIVSVAAIVFIVSLYRKLQPGQTALKWGLPLVLGGALGNLVDRIRYGYVVDFIDVYMQMDGRPKHWPTFNVADIAICIGVALMAIDMFTSREGAEEKKPDSAKAITPEVGDKPAPDAATTTAIAKGESEEKAMGEGA